jgi:hypothetical protein
MIYYTCSQLQFWIFRMCNGLAVLDQLFGEAANPFATPLLPEWYFTQLSNCYVHVQINY